MAQTRHAVNRTPGPLAKLFGWLLLALSLGAFAMVNYHAFANPGSGRCKGLLCDVVPIQYLMVFIDVVIFGGLFLLYRFARKHERAMKAAGFDPREIGETYWESYALRARAEAMQRGGDVGERMTLDLVKRMVGLDAPRVLSPAEIRAAVRQAAPVPGTSPPADLLGSWTSLRDASAQPGWTAQVELRETAGSYRARLWFWADSGVRDSGESEASVREGFVEVKREDAGETRVLRLTPGGTPDSIDVNEYRFPTGKPNRMKVNSCVLRRVRA
jgi:hypothetical protein